MSVPPTGTVTFLFTDIEGSTKMWERDAATMQAALARHDEILRNAIEANGGYVFKTVGDAFCAAFPTAPDALEAALEAQRRLVEEQWGESSPLRVRMALHVGAAEERDGDYFGPPLNRVARLLSAGHGGQILVSRTMQELVRDELPEGAELRDLGEVRLKGLIEHERVFQLIVADLPSSFPPLKTLDERLNNLPAPPTPLVGREGEVAEICGLLRRKNVQLLTLTGLGGTGKTRLGLQAVAELLDEFEDGVFFAPLAPITDPDLVGSTIARELGVMETGKRTPAEGLKDYLRAKELLLVLDNFERVVGAAPLVVELLAACPRLKVLAISRSALQVYGEQEYAVLPLTLRDPERQQTLRSAIEWGHGVLDEGEKKLFARLAVFSGGSTLEAIEEICDAEGDLPIDVLDGVSSFLDKNLLRKEEGPEGEPRFVMLETIHEFAREKLEESGEAEETRRLHAEYYLTLAEGAEPELRGPHQLVWFEKLEAEHDNLTAALSWAIERGRAETALRLAGALWWFWFVRGPGVEGVGWLERALALDGSAGASVRARALHGAGWLVEGQGDHERALSFYEEGLELFREAKDEAGVAFLVCSMGWSAMLRGDYDKAVELNEEGLASSRGSGDEWITALALHNLGCVASERQDYARAKGLLEEALVLARKVGDRQLLSTCASDLGTAAMYAGDHERAETLLEEGMALRDDIGQRDGRAHDLLNLALTVMAQGDRGRAGTLHKESLALSRGVNHELHAAAALSAAGCVAEQKEEAVRAARLWGAAGALREAMGRPMPSAERALLEPYLAAARRRLGEASWKRAWEEGRAMNLDEAISYALEGAEENP